MEMEITKQLLAAMATLMHPVMDEATEEYQANGRVITAYIQSVQRGVGSIQTEATYKAGLIETYRKLREVAAKYPKGAEYRTYIEGQMDSLEESLRFWDSDMVTAMGYYPKAIDELLDRLLAE